MTPNKYRMWFLAFLPWQKASPTQVSLNHCFVLTYIFLVAVLLSLLSPLCTLSSHRSSQDRLLHLLQRQQVSTASFCIFTGQLVSLCLLRSLLAKIIMVTNWCRVLIVGLIVLNKPFQAESHQGLHRNQTWPKGVKICDRSS